MFSKLPIIYSGLRGVGTSLLRLLLTTTLVKYVPMTVQPDFIPNDRYDFVVGKLLLQTSLIAHMSIS